MASTSVLIKFSGSRDALETVFGVLESHKNEDYYAYEREDTWYIGLGSKASLSINHTGENITVTGERNERDYSVDKDSTVVIVREFVSANSTSGNRIYGQAGFNYAAYIRNQKFNIGKWPLLSLMVPRIEITLCGPNITITGLDEEEVIDLFQLIKHDLSRLDLANLPTTMKVNTHSTTGEYITRVKNALSEIAREKYVKVVLSRAVDISDKIDMPKTLLLGRRSNTPARSFSMHHMDMKATGFSPELVLSVKNGKVTTEPLAGTRSCKGTAEEVAQLRHELLHDPKEIAEHMISVKEAIRELIQVCSRDTIAVEELMSIRERGPVQHLGSTISGLLSPDKDIWDAFGVLFPSITASGAPKSSAIEAIQRLESTPRELYSGAVLFIEGPENLEAALVLRSVFQDSSRQWIQAGAGVILKSNPQRELTETEEKLASIAPFVVADLG
ncbi:salicylate synthetase [Penicillium angulare]|uniref:Salicylate synthetase n=1 Tax=Penicillium angulare TaxID=116970 RepID=A0A9W9K696_9EURO|nr:salicylate synthetase [Penicillium angulare]